jgi:hypothetical protein
LPISIWQAIKTVESSGQAINFASNGQYERLIYFDRGTVVVVRHGKACIHLQLLLHADHQLYSFLHHQLFSYELLCFSREIPHGRYHHHTRLFFYFNLQSCSLLLLFLPLSWPLSRPSSLRALEPAHALTFTSSSLVDGTRTVSIRIIRSIMMGSPANTLSQTPAVKATSLPASALSCLARPAITKTSHTMPTPPTTAHPSPMARLSRCNR